MSLINVNLTDNIITPNNNNYNNVIDNYVIYCDLSGTLITNNNFNLVLTLDNNNNNNIQKCNVLFRNNGVNPIINTLKINNINCEIYINNRDTSTSQMTNQEFIIMYNAGTYTSISTIRKYN